MRIIVYLSKILCFGGICMIFKNFFYVFLFYFVLVVWYNYLFIKILNFIVIFLVVINFKI